jgi:homodimeric-type pyruvate dehydrogenase E1 component
MDALSGVIANSPNADEGRANVRTSCWSNCWSMPASTALTCRFRPPPATSTPLSRQEERCPGNLEIEERLRAYMRWNAMAMVVKANRHNPADGGDLGGHIGSFASLANLFGAGFNHFWHAESENHGGDCIYIQGHVSPGVYARAYLEGRLTEEQLLNFRQEVDGKGLSSYPHPKLMPEFWQFPTVSMGLGPLMAIYQARFLKYLHARGIANTENRKVWVFCGDGEMDEVESLGAIGLAARENLDNLVFVINCNLQRLDGPVRGNGKIIQELEGEFRGSGWNVIKLLWGSNWDPLLARDKDGALRKIMMDTNDGDYQAFKANDGAYVRKHFFGRDPRTLEMVANMSDDDIWNLRRGGHDPQKVYAAFHKAVNHKGQPTVLLIKTVKGLAWARSVRARTPCTRPRSSPTKTSRPSATASTSPSPTASCPSCRSTSRPTTRPRCSTCTSAARRWAATCRTAAPRPTRASPCRRWKPSRPCWSPPPRAAKSPPPRPMCAF